MARGPRIQTHGGTYHVTAHAITGARLFRTPDDLGLFIELAERVVRRHGWACFAYCLMPTHYHLLIQVPDLSLSEGIKYLNGTYAQRFNGRHRTRGHVFDARFHSGLVEREAHVLEALRYVALNPVRAGLCAEPVEWRWSSYGALIGEVPAPTFLAVEWVLQLFDVDRALARDHVRSFVAGGLAEAVTLP